MTGSIRPVGSVTGAALVTEALQQLERDNLTIELLIEPEQEAEWNKEVKKRHYLKQHRLVGESLRYVAKLNGKPVAYLGWSSAAFHLQARDTWIGWTEPLRKTRRQLVACNARFVLLGPKSPASVQLASRILSLNRLWNRVSETSRPKIAPATPDYDAQDDHSQANSFCQQPSCDH